MGIFRKLAQIPNNFLYKYGYRSLAEYKIKQLDPKDQQQGKQYLAKLTTLNNIADPEVGFRVLQEFDKFCERTNLAETTKAIKASKTVPSNFYSPQDAGYFGTRPQGSKIWSLFANPFGVFAYCDEQYGTVGRCFDLVRETITADGFALKGKEGVSEEKLIEYYKRLSALDIEELWVEFAIHNMAFGNFFALPHYSKRNRVLKKYEILYPPRLYPKFNKATYEIEEYQYTIGRLSMFYDVSEVDHAMHASLFGKQLGPPPLLSCITEIETALMTIAFNNNVMQKGGLVGKIVALEAQAGDDINSSISSDWQAEVQASLSYIHSGTKAGQELIALTGVKDVHDITRPGEIEANYRESRPEIDKRVCTRLGIPSEKIGIPRSSAVQYQPSLVENVINAEFDRTINSYTTKAARFFNRKLLQEKLGIYDAVLVPAGRYGAMTLAAAQSVKELAAGGPITTVNEARTQILGWAPLPPNDPRGNQVLDMSANRDPEAVAAAIAPESIDPELEADKSLGKIQEGNCLFIKFGANGGEISTEGPVTIWTRVQEKD